MNFQNKNMKKKINKKQAIVINLAGGPGCGKSILASDVFSALKKKYVECELSSEYIKRKIREDARKVVQNQIYIFAKQQFQLFGMKDNVQVIITDSPIFLSAVYDDTQCKNLRQLIMKEFNGYKNFTYLLERNDKIKYEQEGRYQDLEGAKQVDEKVKKFMKKNDIKYKTLKGIDSDSLNIIIKDALKAIGRK
jgi:nicotinamide riboside kinase